MAGARSLLLVLLVLQSQSGCRGFRSPLSVFKRFKETTRSVSNECLGTSRPVTPIDSSDFALDIRMPGVTPKQLTSNLGPAWILSIICYFLDVTCLHPREVTGFVMKEPAQTRPTSCMPGQGMRPLPDSPKVLDSELEERLEVNTSYYKYTMGTLVHLEIITRTVLVCPYISHACHSP
uniref:Peptidylglycine alpha-amidating monooxygenase n=1 Tax=Pipistrellus kuhlii TaxID=59472 RepID=A0A7J7YYT9_PIPKU|nr:peptidylglycine alpha-amidating monooxygenase [Pipistrellus kuhlii]